MELKTELTGPMVGAACVNVHLESVRDSVGRQYLVVLQFGGHVPSTCTSSSRVGDVWVKNPQQLPSVEPVVTLMLSMGGPRDSINAAGILENARCGLGLFLIALWEEGEVVQLSAAVIAKLAQEIEAAIPEPLGEFVVSWKPVTEDGVPV